MLLSEYIEGKWRASILQRLEIEILAESDDFRVVLMSGARGHKVDVELLACLLVENHRAALRNLIRLRKVTSLHDVYSHEPEEIIRDRIALEIDALTFVVSSPTHS